MWVAKRFMALPHRALKRLGADPGHSMALRQSILAF
jgi:hypothetical protein